MANDILKYTSRDYDSIKTDLIDAIPSLTGLWTSREESDPGIVLVKMMSALGDMTSYNFDRQALEYYSSTVTQRKNASKLFSLVGYNMHWYQSALTTVTLTYTPTIDEEWLMYIVQGALSESEEAIINSYYEYRNRYHINKTEGTNPYLSIPPITSSDGSQEVIPIEWFPNNGERYSIYLSGEQYYDPEGQLPESIKNNEYFRRNALQEFKPYCDDVFKAWANYNESGYGLHTYVNDSNRNLELYANDSSSMVYSILPLEPTSVEILQNSSSKYPPSVILKPYIPQSFTAVQGYIASVTFTNTQLKNNRFYLPDSAIDDVYMYLSYDSTLVSDQTRKIGFAVKTENLLTVTKVEGDDGKEILYFQFGVDDYDYPYIELVSYWNTIFPESSVQFTLYYFRTYGSDGNITNNYLTRLGTASNTTINVINTDTNITVYDVNGNPLSKPGKNPQTAHDAYIDSINYIMTYNTLVTIYDWARFTRRQLGITNAVVADKQRAKDLNKQIKETCLSYTSDQLRSILGVTDTTIPKEELANTLYKCREIIYDYKQSYVYGNQETTHDDFVKYSLNVYPIYGNYLIEDSLGDNIALYTNTVLYKGEEVKFPYYLYKIKDSNDTTDSREYKLSTMLDKAYDSTYIVNVEANYSALRVFPWRCCCVLHLTKSVDEDTSKQIVNNVINYLSIKYSPENMEFGKKLSYMDIIQTILDADDRIRYVDAGVGTKKLIEFDNNLTDEPHYNTEAYFNPISIMRYVQTIKTNSDINNSSYNYISVDPSYIQGGVVV